MTGRRLLVLAGAPAARWLLLLALLVSLCAVPVARADGDPASDYLLGMRTFVPPDAGFSTAAKDRLTELVSGARKGTSLSGGPACGYTIRVAVIASRYDLGSVTALDKQPKRYAHFLSQELRFVYRGRLLVVMANGYGIARNGRPNASEQKVLDRLPPPAAGHGSGLEAATERAVRTLARNAGVRIASAPVALSKQSSAGDTTTRDRIVIAAIAVAALCAALVVGLYRRWR